MSTLMSVSESRCGEKGVLTRYVAPTSGSITDITAGDCVRCFIERLEVCAGGEGARNERVVLPPCAVIIQSPREITSIPTGSTLGNGVVHTGGFDANRSQLVSQTASKGATQFMNLRYDYQSSPTPA